VRLSLLFVVGEIFLTYSASSFFPKWGCLAISLLRDPEPSLGVVDPSFPLSKFTFFSVLPFPFFTEKRVWFLPPLDPLLDGRILFFLQCSRGAGPVPLEPPERTPVCLPLSKKKRYLLFFLS